MSRQLETAFLKAKMAEKRGERAQALAIYQSVLDQFPRNVRAAKALAALQARPEISGNASAETLPALIEKMAQMSQDGHSQQAAVLGEALLAQFPDVPQIKAVLATIYTALRRHADAEHCYRAAIKAIPEFAEMHAGLGDALSGQGRQGEAISSYRRAIEIEPRFAKAMQNLGHVHNNRAEWDDALALYRRAVEADPSMSEAFSGMGEALTMLNRFDEAAAAYERAVAIRPQDPVPKVALLRQQTSVADWRNLGHLEGVLESIARGDKAAPPFNLLALDGDPARQRRYAELWSAKLYASASPHTFSPPPARPERLRIGYFSADLGFHPMMIVTAAMFHTHDRSRFEICVYSSGADDDMPERHALKRDVERFVDIREMSDADVIALVGQHSLDIAIDLGGHTQFNRSRLFKDRLAPIQMQYIGYPGTMGAPFIDYILADPVVIPEAERAHYSEQVIALPQCYFPADNRRAIAPDPGTRQDHGLPETGFVFCCFNNTAKISPREFDIWCRLLGKVEGSVLWLLITNEVVIANFRREAAARGIDPARLVFGGRVDGDKHLARHVHADLFLDTFNYNAHTTATDALWAGLPLVTREGRSFAARVGSSVLQAVGLPELVTRSDADYEALALALATDPARLTAIRSKLAANRLTTPLFDSEGHTRALERGYEAAYARFLAGLPPADIAAG